MQSNGHTAETPRDLTWSDWKAVVFRVKDEIVADRVGLIAAGIAFYGLLALFPAITAVMAIGGLFLEPSQITEPLQRVTEVLPQRAASIIIEQAQSVTGSDQGGLGLAAVLGIALAVYSASKGVAHLIEGLNVAYDEEETRGFLKLKATTLLLTALLVLVVLVAIASLLVLPPLLNMVNLGIVTEWLVSIGRWIALLVFAVLSMAVIYRFGPDRQSPKLSWVLPGALLACVLWLIASAAFAIYSENFGSYQETFGTLAGAIVLLMWLWISAYVVLIGAELNGELEAQIFADTTVGKSMPRGSRGAVKADQFKGANADG